MVADFGKKIDSAKSIAAIVSKVVEKLKYESAGEI